MLHALAEYARREGLAAVPGLAPKMVRAVLRFTPQGEFLGILDLAEGKKSKGRLIKGCPDLSQGEMVSSGCRHFLVDTAEVVLLLIKKDKPNDKQIAKHRSFVDVLRQASDILPELQSIIDSLESEEVLAQIREKAAEIKLKPTDNVTVAVEDRGRSRLLVEDTRWHSWWQDFRAEIAEKRKKPAKRGKPQSPVLMADLLTGDLVEPVATQDKIKGLAGVGGASSGDVIAGFDKDAFTSYGLEQGQNAAMSENNAKLCVTALNDLIRNRSHTFGGTKVCYWYSRQVEASEDVVATLWGDEGGAVEADEETPDESEQRQLEDRVRNLLRAVRAGERPDLADARYYNLTLSGNGGRVMVRDWFECNFETLAANISKWFDDLAIIHRDGKSIVSRFKFMAVVGAAYRDLKDAPGRAITALWKAAVGGNIIPHDVAARTLDRVRIDFIQGETPRHARLGLLKAFVIRNQGVETMKPELNDLEKDPAYLCGRIMALLAAIQRKANPEVQAGIVQRYYAAASATPALVLGRLVRSAQIAHLPKIEPEGLRIWFENKLAELWSRLDACPPRTLTLEGQTRFALGYYHQLADRGQVNSDLPETSEAEA
ncbi:type I-C CRISPR-associated protein Cas8c/Csd1 [Thermostilla marina]